MNSMIQDEPAVRKLPRRPLGPVLALASALFWGVIPTPAARAQTYSVLYSFQCAPNDGSAPASPLTLDAAGNLFGTTGLGGSSDLGTVFELSADGTETVLYSFTGGLDGSVPFGVLLQDASGNLYGTTEVGGANKGGVAFKLTPEGTETVLHSFGVGSDGTNPTGGLIREAAEHFTAPPKMGGPSGLEPFTVPLRTAKKLFFTASAANQGMGSIRTAL